MTPTLTREQVRELDRRATAEFAVPSIVLMENAGRGTAELLVSLGIHGRVAICCGKGNNGGDGLVVARHLDHRRVAVDVLLFAEAEQVTGDARVNLEVIRRMGLPLHELPRPQAELGTVRSLCAKADWVVDALFGTGLTGPIHSPLAEVVELINHSSARVLAVDLPSGLDADTGLPLGPTVRATHTATFVAWKRGFLTPSAAAWTGQIHVLSIGAPRRLVEEYLAANAGHGS
jgi:NAD(P)H-hydrate epimerase